VHAGAGRKTALEERIRKRGKKYYELKSKVMGATVLRHGGTGKKKKLGEMIG